MHILLFILFFIIAIIVFGLSIVGFLLRTFSGSDAVRHRHITERPDKANKATIKGRTILMMMKRKFCPRILRQESKKKYSPKMMVNM